MIKLYIFYIVFGAYMFFMSWAVYLLSFFGISPYTYLALFSSAISFLIIPGLSLYHIRWASIVGLVGLTCVFPFGISWLILRFGHQWPRIQDADNIMILLATLLYVIAVGYSIRYAFGGHKSLKKTTIKNTTKLWLTFLPILLFTLFGVWLFIGSN